MNPRFQFMNTADDFGSRHPFGMQSVDEIFSLGLPHRDKQTTAGLKQA